MRAAEHIRGVNRASSGPLITTALAAVAGVLAWLFWIGDPCLGTHIANRWGLKNLSEVVPSPVVPIGAVSVENPYGIRTCHYWPTAADQVVNVLVFAILIFSIGWMTARRIPHRPLLIASAMSTTAMLIALSLQAWAQWERITFSGSPLLAVLVIILIAAIIAMLGAWFAVRFTRRV